MFAGWIGEILKEIVTQNEIPIEMPADLLRRDLSNIEYADWFLGPKFQNMALKPAYSMNDFVLFRVANNWPDGLADWYPNNDDLLSADYSLTVEQACDLAAFSDEGLHDGCYSAEWYLRVSILMYCDKGMPLHEVMVEALQSMLFLPKGRNSLRKKGNRGRKKSDLLDRNRVVRNLVEGLLLRGCSKTESTNIASVALGRVGIGITQDAVRKIFDQTERTDREARLWTKMLETHTTRFGK